MSFLNDRAVCFVNTHCVSSLVRQMVFAAYAFSKIILWLHLP